VNARDPFELFGLLDPDDDEPLTGEDEKRLRRILETPVVGGPRNRGGSRRLVIAIAAGAVVMATAAFAVLHRDRASNPTAILCYRTADLNGDRAALPAAVDPIAVCGTPWSDGTFSRTGSPKLVGCVNSSRVAVVFPGDPDLCSRLGLAELAADRSVEQQAVVDLQDRLAEIFSANCYHQAEALTEAQQVLDESHLAGWTVHLAEDFPPGLECGAPGVLPDTKTVTVGGGRPENP
jgi:hypothetical protein